MSVKDLTKITVTDLWKEFNGVGDFWEMQEGIDILSARNEDNVFIKVPSGIRPNDLIRRQKNLQKTESLNTQALRRLIHKAQLLKILSLT